jgi:hypothetical protein
LKAEFEKKRIAIANMSESPNDICWPFGHAALRAPNTVWIRAPTKSRKDQHDQFLQRSRNLVSTTSKQIPQNVHKVTKAGFYGS